LSQAVRLGCSAAEVEAAFWQQMQGWRAGDAPEEIAE
jgi:hypothetical protein